MVDIMGFAREVRDMVHEFSLCMDGILAPHREKHKIDGDYDGPPPTVALLATNKQVRDEALPILFSKNTRRISSKATTLSERCFCDPTDNLNSGTDPEYDHNKFRSRCTCFNHFKCSRAHGKASPGRH